MAPSAPEQITTAYRRQQDSLRAATVRDVARLWPALDWRRLEATYPAWLLGVQTLVARNRGAANTLAAQYLRAFRLVSGAPGDLAVILAPAAPLAQVQTSLEVTGPVAFKTAIGAGQTIEKASQSALVQAAGAASRLVLDGGRDTIRLTTVADPACDGWQRVASGRECDFCQMLVGRGAVYSSDSADFQSHDHCSCSAEPVYR